MSGVGSMDGQDFKGWSQLYGEGTPLREWNLNSKMYF